MTFNNSNYPFPLGVVNSPLTNSLYEASGDGILPAPPPGGAYLITQDGKYLVTQDGLFLVTQ